MKGIVEKPWFNVRDLMLRWNLDCNEVLDLALDRKINFFVDIRKKQKYIYEGHHFVWDNGHESSSSLMNVWEDLLLSLYRPEYIDDLVTPRVTGGFVTCPDFGVDEYFKIEIKPGFTSDDSRSENYCPPPGFVVYQEDLIIPRESVHTFEKSFTADTKNENPEISEKIEGKYLRIIKGLMDLLKEKRIAPYTQDLIVDKLLEKYADADSFPGDTSIKQVFAKANKLEP